MVVVDLQERFASLTPEKQRLLVKRLREKGVDVSQLPIVPQERKGQPWPLSYAQERLWMLDRLQPDSAAYNLAVGFRLRGALDVATLEQSLNEIVRRHEMLRTTFQIVDEQPVQTIMPEATLRLHVQDLRDVPANSREVVAQQRLHEQIQQPFNLGSESKLRAILLQLQAEEYIFALVMHHIAADGWSFGVLIQELGALYGAFAAGQMSPLEALPVQYADYAHWQREWLHGDAIESRLTYWKEQLQGNVPALRLPTEHVVPMVPSQHADSREIILPDELLAALRSLSRQQNVTLFITLLAAFQAVLHRYTGQQDVVVCSPVAGRDRAETERLIGYFNNIVALRGDLSGEPTFAELLERINRVVLDAHDNQEVPFQKVAELPNLARTPLSRALFALQDTTNWRLDLSGLTVEPLGVDNGATDFDLAFYLNDQAGTITGILKYKTDLFRAEVIEQLLSDFVALLTSVAKQPDQPLAELPVVGPTSRGNGSAAQHTNGHSSAPLPTDMAANNNFAPENERPPLVAPRDELELKLTRLWEKVLGISPIGINDNFFHLGGHSILVARLFGELEKQVTGQKLPLATLLHAPTVARLADVLRNEGWKSSWSSLVPMQTAGDRPNFFCVHAHWGNVVGYRELTQSMGSDQPFYALQARGLDDHDKPLECIEDMATLYIEEIRSVQPHGPYFIGGWCLGGTIAFEMAQQLTAAGEEVALLAMMQPPHPDYPRYLPESKGTRRLLLKLIERFDYEMNIMRQAEKDNALEYLWQRVLRVGTIARNTSEKMLNAALQRLGYEYTSSSTDYKKDVIIGEAHLRAFEAYQPRPYHGRTVIYRTSKQPLGIYPDATLGWDTLVQGERVLYEVSSFHLNMLHMPYVQQMGRHIRHSMDQAAREIAPPLA
jgi:thioesterase domain-containing protein